MNKIINMYPQKWAIEKEYIAAKLTGIPTNLDTLVACTLLQEEHPRKQAMILFPGNDSSSHYV